MIASLLIAFGITLSPATALAENIRTIDWHRVSIESAARVSAEAAVMSTTESAAGSPAKTVTDRAIVQIPFYSQFTDIPDPAWKKVGCGIVSLAMVIDYYKPGTVAVPDLLREGIEADAYLQRAGWTYAGLISVARPYGLDGESFDLGRLNTESAFAAFQNALADGPIIASVHYKFDPKSTIPHLVVINDIRDGVVYYNDPAAKTGGLTISAEDFLKAWKKRYIVIRPSPDGLSSAKTTSSR
jgi:predicted double-glycine peptidase